MTAEGLIGRWEMARAELAGESAPEGMMQRVELEFSGHDYVVRFGGQVSDRGTYALEAGRVVFHGVEGPNRGRSIPAIFQQVGDRLRICYGLDGQAPTEFATAAGARRYLAVYRRKT